MVSTSSGATVRGSITSTEIPSLSSCSHAFRVLVDHRGQGDHRHVASLPHHGGLAELDLVIPGGHRALHRRASRGAPGRGRGRRSAGRCLSRPLASYGGGGDDDAQAGEVGEHRVVVARMVRGRRVADADAAAQQDRHLQPAAAHVLHLGDLVDDLADGVEDEIGEHEVDDRPGPRSWRRPQPRPTKPRSLIGVSHSRSGP